MRRRLQLLAPFAPFAAGLVTAAAVAAVLASSSATSPRYFAPEPPKPSPFVAQPAASTSPGSCQITAQVMDGADARAGVDVTLDRVTAEGSVEEWRALTDKNGVHRFVDVPAGDYQLTATKDDRQPAGAPAWSCTGNSERAFFSLALASSEHVLTGTVASAAGGKAAGAQIAIAQDVDGRTGLAGVARVPVNVDGSFSVRLLPGKYQLLVQAPHHASMVRKLWLADGTMHANAKFNLVPAPRVTGRVVDENGTPVAGALVAIGGILDPKQRAPSINTDETGAFSLPVPMDADVVVTARASSGLVARVELGKAQTALGFLDEVLVTHHGRSVEGFVTKPDGDPWAFGSVHYRVRDLGLQGTETADAAGHFVVAGMPEDADVEVWAEGNATGAWGAQVATPGNDKLALVYTPPAY